jgi:hypothetical protein
LAGVVERARISANKFPSTAIGKARAASLHALVAVQTSVVWDRLDCTSSVHDSKKIRLAPRTTAAALKLRTLLDCK